MFDYQAGEKYKLTLIMVGVAGLLAGMFFTLLLMPTPDSASMRKRNPAAYTKAMSDPDVTGRRGGGGGNIGYGSGAAAALGVGAPSGQSGASAPQIQLVDRGQASMFMQNWLPRIMDLSANTAAANQEEAIKWMTPDCAAAYRNNVWTADLANQVQQSGLQSQFAIRNVDVSDNLADGSVVIKVQGEQTLGAAGKGGRKRAVNLEYMMKQTPDGMRIAGISEGGQTH